MSFFLGVPFLLVHNIFMNTLTLEKKKAVIAALVEGNSLRSTVRMTGVHRTTIQKLLVDLGAKYSAYQGRIFRNLKLRYIQCEEIWSFVGCKEKNATRQPKLRAGAISDLDRTRRRT